MSERRCPSCGGLVAEDADWCGQCLARLDGDSTQTRTEDAPEPAVSSGADNATAERGGKQLPGPTAAIRVDDGRPIWACPSCGHENDLDDELCVRCSFRFASLFEEEPRRPRVSATRAATLSAILPGAGHVAAGHVADGVARFVVFVYALGTALVVLIAGEAGPLVPLGGVALLAAVAVYVTGTLDAARVAEGRPPVLPNRVLLYGAIALMLLTVAVLVVSSLRVSSAR